MQYSARRLLVPLIGMGLAMMPAACSAQIGPTPQVGDRAPAFALPDQNLHHIYFGSGFRFLGIFSNADETPEKLAAFAKDHHLTFPLPLDRYGKIAYSFGVAVTPEVWMVDEHGIAVYHGAVDDNVNASVMSSPYLMQAMDAIVLDSDPPKPETRPLGDALHRAGQS